MLRYIYGNVLADFPNLKTTMFQDRAKQFSVRRGWDVDVDGNGEEIDRYDALNPLYVIWETPSGDHGGSMRFLPTTGQTMINDHFSHITDGVKIVSPRIWECTRFCLAEGAGGRVAAALMLAGAEILRGFELDHFIGVFDTPMQRIYRLIGASPTVVGSTGKGKDKTSVGLWEFSVATHARVLARSGISDEMSTLWFEQAFSDTEKLRLTA